jgi:hypothetical protein
VCLSRASFQSIFHTIFIVTLKNKHLDRIAFIYICLCVFVCIYIYVYIYIYIYIYIYAQKAFPSASEQVLQRITQDSLINPEDATVTLERFTAFTNGRTLEESVHELIRIMPKTPEDIEPANVYYFKSKVSEVTYKSSKMMITVHRPAVLELTRGSVRLSRKETGAKKQEGRRCAMNALLRTCEWNAIAQNLLEIRCQEGRNRTVTFQSPKERDEWVLCLSETKAWESQSSDCEPASPSSPAR